MRESLNKLKGFGREYWKFWIASAVSMAASNILQFVLSLYVLDITGSATIFALMLSIVFVPRLILTPFAGVLSDKVDRSNLMGRVLIAESVVLLAYSVMSVFVPIKVALVFILVLLLEMGEVFYNACEGAIIPLLVDEDRLKDAIAVSKSDDGIVFVISPIIAAFIFTNINLTAAFVFVTILDFAAGILQFSIKSRQQKDESDDEKIHFIRNFKEGVLVILENNKLRNLAMTIPVINAFFGATFSVSILYLIREVYNMNAYYYGMYNSVTAITTVIVPLVVLPIVSKAEPGKIFSISTKLITSEIALIGLVVLLSLRSVVPIMAALLTIIALDCMTIAEAIPMQIAMSVLIQTNVKKELLGRVTTTMGMLSMISVALGEMLFGVLNDAFIVYVSIFVGAIGVGVGSIMYSILTRWGDGLSQGDGSFDSEIIR